MSQTTYFTPGPSQLYPNIDGFIKDALDEDVGSISHRSGAFKGIYADTVSRLHQLLSLPENFHVLFLGSATESWERIFNSLVEKKSYHYVNGSFSKKFHQYGIESGKESIKEEAPFGAGFDVDTTKIPQDTELVAFTQNETSSGVMTGVEDIEKVRKSHPNALVAVDVVSSLPYPNFDYNNIDTLFFSVQKCFGLPAGLGVWIVNDRCVKKAEELKAKGHQAGAHHTLLELVSKAKENQTPSTPNALNIYLLSRVLESMLEKGAEQIRKETDEKYELLHQLIAESSFLSESVENERHRSKTVIVANTAIEPSVINGYLKQFNMAVGSGYGSYKTSQIRIANFPAHSTAAIKELIEALKKEELINQPA